MRSRIIAGLSALAFMAGVGGAAASSAQAAYMTAGDACNVTGSPFAHGVQFPGGVNPYDRALYVMNVRGNQGTPWYSYRGTTTGQFPDITNCDIGAGTGNICTQNGATYCWPNKLGLWEFMAESWYVTSTNHNTVAYVTLESSVCWVKYPDGSPHQFSC